MERKPKNLSEIYTAQEIKETQQISISYGPKNNVAEVFYWI